MHILVVTGSFPARSETFIYRKVEALVRRGHRVTVATRTPGDWSLYPPLPSGAAVVDLLPDHSLRSPRRALSATVGAARIGVRDPAAVRRLYASCERAPQTRVHARKHFLRHLPFVGCHADVVHFEFLSLGAMYPLASEVLGIPVVVSCRGTDLHTLELLGAEERAAALHALERATAIHCVSAELAEEVARIAGRRHGVWINRPAVDVDAIRLRVDEPHRRPLRIVATGRLVWKKGFDYLLAALARLAEARIDFEAEILGDGELKSSLRFSIEDLGLASRVRLAGAVTAGDVLAHLQQADVFVLSSVMEGISNAALEAMASGVPVVTTDVGGMREAITDGVEGLVVPVRDVPALASALERLAYDRETRVAMGRAARLRAEREFSLARQVSVFEELYRSVAGGRE